KQAMLTESIHLKLIANAISADNFLVSQINSQLIAFVIYRQLHQFIYRSLRQDDRQQAVFEAVVVENIGKPRRDDGAKAIFIQRPGRVFAAGATTEVFLGDQNAGTLVARLVQHKPGVQRTLAVVLAGLAFVQIAPLVKQVFTKTGAL